jgi:hypothetical protein
MDIDRQKGSIDLHIYVVLLALTMFAAGVLTTHYFHTFSAGRETSMAPPQPKTVTPREHAYFSMPKTLTLCGETMPLQNQHVREMLDREFNITVWDRAQVIMYLKRAGRYFPYIEVKLAEAGLPDDLKYLAVAESALITHSLSRKGARGPWQFMTLAARSNGLRRNSVIDERLNFERATAAAIKNLTRLKEKFSSWMLAMAAYNTGETRLSRAIKNQQTDDYFRLNLPIETERYVFRIAAIKIIMENPGQYGYALPKEQMYAPPRFDAIDITLNSALNIVSFAEAIGTDFKDIKERNPQFLRDYIPSGSHTVMVPPGTGMLAVAYLKSLNPKTKKARLVYSDRKPVDTH